MSKSWSLERQPDGTVDTDPGAPVPPGPPAGGITLDPAFEAAGGTVSSDTDDFGEGSIITVTLPGGGFGTKPQGVAPWQFWLADDPDNPGSGGGWTYPQSRAIAAGHTNDGFLAGHYDNRPDGDQSGDSWNDPQVGYVSTNAPPNNVQTLRHSINASGSPVAVVSMDPDPNTGPWPKEHPTMDTFMHRVLYDDYINEERNQWFINIPKDGIVGADPTPGQTLTWSGGAVGVLDVLQDPNQSQNKYSLRMKSDQGDDFQSGASNLPDVTTESVTWSGGSLPSRDDYITGGGTSGDYGTTWDKRWNLKYWRFYAQTGPDKHNYSSPDSFSTFLDSNQPSSLSQGIEGSGAPSGGSYRDPGNSSVQARHNLWRQRWIAHELVHRESDIDVANGGIRQFVDGVGGTDAGDAFKFPGMTRNTAQPESKVIMFQQNKVSQRQTESYETEFSYWQELYVDDSFCRITVGTGDGLGSGASDEGYGGAIQIPLAWADGQVQFQFRRGIRTSNIGDKIIIHDSENVAITIGTLTA